MTVQGLIVMAIAALAAAFLAWRVAGPFLRRSASSGCHGCSTPCELQPGANRKPRAEPGAASQLRFRDSGAARRDRN